MALLEIESLEVEFPVGGRVLRAVDDVSLSVGEGEVLGIVGESGSGKSVTMLALMGLIAYPGRLKARRVTFDGRDLLRLSDRERRQLTGRDMAMIFQEPATSLNPCFSVGFQLVETLRQHMKLSHAAATDRAVELLAQVGIPDPGRRLQDYPHLLSGGMNQRVMIAMAIACNPRLLIADEPTTALDVTIQAQILDLLRQLQRERGMALVLITHNMGVVAEMAQRVAVMYAGQVVEDRPAPGLFAAPEHPYTAALLAALPERHGDDGGRLATIPGMVPGLYDRPRGCLFSPRCVNATLKCHQQQPGLTAMGDGRVRCHYPISTPGREAAIERDRHVGALAARHEVEAGGR
ncbi:MAG TPA: ABC transporter ATP-binding protein [Burkholderiaceae bacterium]|nr:ABC transporter ATP-binding protein [Burkholderiaceae bacterium]HQR72404.1 ABC transporter ATP-binding protein [Burkholderiaceae bacterium]